MVRRLFWLLLGRGLGVGITVRAQRVVRASIERYVPDPMVDRFRVVNDALEERALEIRLRRRVAERRAAEEQAAQQKSAERQRGARIRAVP